MTTTAAHGARLGRARWRRRSRATARNFSLRTGLALLGALLAVGVLGWVTLPDPNRQDLAVAFARPGSAGHLLGTDALGRDVLAWISAGIWVSLAIAVGVVALSAFVGITAGLCAGYLGRWADTLVMRVVDLELAVPPLLLFISAAAVARPGPVGLVLLLAAVSWIAYARLARNVIQVEREKAYVAAARLAGATRRRVIFRHLFRAVGGTSLVIGSLQAGYAILWESALSFVGLGVRPPLNSLGFLINDGRATMHEAWWVVIFPGIAVALLVMAANLIGDGLRDRLHDDVEPTRR
ncbi:MAG: ABC transporter permease [Conexibacter sp.]